MQKYVYFVNIRLHCFVYSESNIIYTLLLKAIRKTYFKKKYKIPKYIKNEEIKDEELRVIDDEGEQLGVIKTIEAKKLAADKNLDLLIVSPSAKPPVAKIVSWSKFKYKLEKKQKEAKAKRIDQKEMWFKSFIDVGDLNHKLKKVKEFLAKKHPVKLTIIAKKRASRELINELMDKILADLEGMVEYDARPKFEGRNLSLIVRPIKNN